MKHPLSIGINAMCAAAVMMLAAAHGHCERPSTPPLDISRAMEMCDRLPMEPIEGLWSFPDDNVAVMICRENHDDGNHRMKKYVMTVVDTPDTRLTPGDTIGWLEASAAPRKFSMTLMTKRGPQTLMQPRRLLAELREDEQAIAALAEKWNVKLNLFAFLKGFWRVVKLQHDNPLKNLPAGLTRLYPKNYDDEVRYL